MNPREVALCIARLRWLIIAGMIADLKGDDSENDKLAAEFEALAQTLPFQLIIFGGLDKRVVNPATRKIEREGILAQNEGGRSE